jgi:hypothetical protein
MNYPARDDHSQASDPHAGHKMADMQGERLNHHRGRERATASPRETAARDPLIGIQALAITRRETAAKHAT